MSTIEKILQFLAPRLEEFIQPVINIKQPRQKYQTTLIITANSEEDLQGLEFMNAWKQSSKKKNVGKK